MCLCHDVRVCTRSFAQDTMHLVTLGGFLVREELLGHLGQRPRFSLGLGILLGLLRRQVGGLLPRGGGDEGGDAQVGVQIGGHLCAVVFSWGFESRGFVGGVIVRVL